MHRFSLPAAAVSLLVALPGGCGAHRATQVEAWMEEGASAGDRGELDVAEAAFQRVLEREPRHGTALANLGIVYLQRAGRAFDTGDTERAEALTQQALELHDRALEADPPGPTNILLLSGRALLHLEQPEQARDRLTRFLALEQANVTEQTEARDLLIRAERWARYREANTILLPHLQAEAPPGSDLEARDADLRRGVALLQAYVAEDASTWPPFWLLGKGLQALGDHTAALEALERAFEIEPTDPDIGREVAVAAVAVGRYDRAVAGYRAVHGAYPHDVGIRINLALALLLAGDSDGALAEIEATQRAAPDNSMVDTVLQHVRAVSEGRVARPTSMDELRSALTSPEAP